MSACSLASSDRATAADADGGEYQVSLGAAMLPLLMRPSIPKAWRGSSRRQKRGNGLRVMAEAVRWGRRGARINAISPGIVMTPLAKDDLNGPRGDGYRRMIAGSAAKRAGTPDEVAAVAALLMGTEGGFITGSDILMDGGVTAAYWYGDVDEVSSR